MLEGLEPVAADPVLQLAVLFRRDLRRDKLDLGIGVYKDAEGRVPLLDAVKRAQRLFVDTETTKDYVGLAGDESFNSSIAKLVLGEKLAGRDVRGVQAVGGQGAIRLLVELIRYAAPDATVWISNPSWANHHAVVSHLGLKSQFYTYYSRSTGAVDFDRMMSDLRAAKAGDVILLHGCCHNPTGADLDMRQWQAIADLCNSAGLVPFVDTAYQALGSGIDEDAAGLRLLAAQVPEMLLAYSCSKNFGVYRDRVGCALVMGSSSASADLAKSRVMALARANYSMPPHQTAAVVNLVLTSRELRGAWERETEEMRRSMRASRSHIVSALRLRTNSDRYDAILNHNGLFSLLGLTPEQVEALRTEHGIFMVGSSRINVAGVSEASALRLATAVARVTT